MGKMVIDEGYATLAEVGKLMRQREPLRVVVDSDLPEGAWYVVRGASPEERRFMVYAASDEVRSV